MHCIMKLSVGILLGLVVVTLAKVELSFGELIKNNDGRIVQGRPASQGQFPFMVRLEVRISGGTRLHAGSLISARHVLTAAHCIESSTFIEIGLGSVDADNPARVIAATKYIIHPEYIYIFQLNDIGLIDMEQDVQVSATIRPIVLPKFSQVEDDFTGRVATVAGWGAVSNNGSQSKYLNYANLSVIANSRCMDDYSPVHILNSTLCANGIDSVAQGVCLGDSGGALFMRDEEGELIQIGIVSFWSNQGCLDGKASGFYRPHHYWPWISEWTGIPIRQ